MITQILLGAGLDPSVIIGGKLPLLQGSGRVGESDLMVCEACEFHDHFLELSSDISVILNIDVTSKANTGCTKASTTRCGISSTITRR